MNSRKLMQTEILMPTDLVSMVCEILGSLSLIDLDRLILLSEQEIIYRQEHDEI